MTTCNARQANTQAPLVNRKARYSELANSDDAGAAALFSGEEPAVAISESLQVSQRPARSLPPAAWIAESERAIYAWSAPQVPDAFPCKASMIRSYCLPCRRGQEGKPCRLTEVF